MLVLDPGNAEELGPGLGPGHGWWMDGRPLVGGENGVQYSTYCISEEKLAAAFSRFLQQELVSE